MQMMFKKSTFKMTYVEEITTKILLLPYAGNELNMIIMLPDEHIDLRMVRSFHGDVREKLSGIYVSTRGALPGSHDHVFIFHSFLRLGWNSEPGACLTNTHH